MYAAAFLLLYLNRNAYIELLNHGEPERRKGGCMLNKVILIGRLGADPEIRYTPDGTMVTNFRLATDEQWKTKTGEKTQKTEWHRIVTFRKLAEICGNYLQKGSLVYIEGRIQTRSWEDKDGTKRYATEIIANQMKMLSGKKEQSESDHSRYEQDDDIPF